MNSQKNPLENFQEISSEKVHLAENLQDKKLFLFQIPKNFDPKALDGIEFEIRGSEHFALDQEDTAMEYVLERVDEAGENYFQNQIMVLKPQLGKSKQKPIHKKISGVYKIHKKFSLGKKISKHAIIKSVPNSLKNIKA